MEDYQVHTYGEKIAGQYDEWFGSYDPAAIDLLAELAQGGPALELGIGTGRIALPLQEKGVEVHGIDASEAMVARLRTKPGGDRIPVSMGDFSEVAVDRRFSLVYIPFNTFFALLTQEAQLKCFRNVSRRLLPNGVFLIEAFFPDIGRYREGGQTVRAIQIDVNQVRLDVARLDAVQQQIHAQQLILSNEGVRVFPVRLRFAWPSELDLMAQLAGMCLRQRWGGWDKSPFTNESGRHISIYELASAD